MKIDFFFDRNVEIYCFFVFQQPIATYWVRSDVPYSRVLHFVMLIRTKQKVIVLVLGSINQKVEKKIMLATSNCTIFSSYMT